MNRTITIMVNGSHKEVPEEATLAFLIELFQEMEPGLIASLNGRMISPQKYAATTISENDKVNFIHCGFSG